MYDFDLLLADRVGVIRTVAEKYDLEHCSYLSFSGGKDSTVLHYLIDMALPDNHIPRVFIDTGIEYKLIRDFVHEFASKDSRFVVLTPKIPIKKVLEKYGYPFKSKIHSHYLSIFQNSSFTDYVSSYVGLNGCNTKFLCPRSLLYQFSPEFTLNVSEKCCDKLKKQPIHSWEKANKRSVAILGVRTDEGGIRGEKNGCVVLDGDSLKKFKPLNPVPDEFEDDFISRFGIKLCDLYYPPYNFKRTGCKGCPFSLDLQEQLTLMAKYLPAEREQCEAIWKPVYAEYRRIGFRLDKNEQLKLF